MAITCHAAEQQRLEEQWGDAGDTRTASTAMQDWRAHLTVILQLLQEVSFEVFQFCYLPVEAFDCLNQRVLFCHEFVLLSHALAGLQESTTCWSLPQALKWVETNSKR